MRSFVKRNPLLTYFVISFGWTWLIVFILVVTGQTRDMNNPSLGFVLGGILSNVSPSIAAFIVKGFKNLKKSLKIKSTLSWYMLTLLTVPFITGITALISNYTIRAYRFNILVPMVMMGLIWPVFSGAGEEFGWRGYLLPELLERFKPVKAAVILGTIWEIWHLPMHYLAYKDFGNLMIPAFLIIGFINLILQTCIMTFIFIRNNGNIKMMILYHYTITASSILLNAFFQTEALTKALIYEGAISVSFFAIAACLLYYKNKSGLKDYKSILNT